MFSFASEVEPGVFIEISKFLCAGVYDPGHPKEICLPELYLLGVGESTFNCCVIYVLTEFWSLLASTLRWLLLVQTLKEFGVHSYVKPPWFLNLLWSALLHCWVCCLCFIVDLLTCKPDYPSKLFLLLLWLFIKNSNRDRNFFMLQLYIWMRTSGSVLCDFFFFVSFVCFCFRIFCPFGQ